MLMMIKRKPVMFIGLLIRALTMLMMPNMTHSQMFQKVESGRGPIFKVVLEC